MIHHASVDSFAQTRNLIELRRDSLAVGHGDGHQFGKRLSLLAEFTPEPVHFLEHLRPGRVHQLFLPCG